MYICIYIYIYTYIYIFIDIQNPVLLSCIRVSVWDVFCHQMEPLSAMLGRNRSKGMPERTCIDYAMLHSGVYVGFHYVVMILFCSIMFNIPCCDRLYDIML